MRHVKVTWIHNLPGEPVLYFSELNEDGHEIRKVQAYRIVRAFLCYCTQPSEYAGVVMVEQTARLSDTCTECGGTREGWAAQLIIDGKLRWEIEWECVGCMASHQRARGPAPKRVRDLLIEQHGADCLRVAREGQNKGFLLKVFREAFSSSIGEAKNLSENATGSGYEGTRVEAALLCKLLRDRGVDVDVIPGSCGCGFLNDRSR